jgi:hypothetical protein
LGLPEKFDKRLKNSLGLRAAWPPGSPIEVGDVLLRDDGIFKPIGSLKHDFGVTYRKEAVSKERSVTFQAQGVSTSILQLGVEVSWAAIDPNAMAEVKIDFNREETYLIRTPQLTGRGIDNMIKVGRQVAQLDEWRHGDYYIAWRVYSATDFAFLGNLAKQRTVKFGGKGSAIVKLLTFGATAGVSKVSQSSVAVEIVGEKGPIAVGVAKIKDDGRVDFH